MITSAIDWESSSCSFAHCLNETDAYDTEHGEYHCHKHYLESAYRLNKKRGNVVFRPSVRCKR